MTVPFRILLALVRFTPMGLGRRLGWALGCLAHYLAPGLRRRSLDSLNIAFGAEKSPREIRALARDSLGQLGATLFEFLKLPSMTDQEVLELLPVEGLERIEAYANKPAIFISGHMGNVILLGVALTLRGYRISTVVRPFTNESLRQLVFKVSDRFKLGVIERRGSRVGVQSLDILKRGEILGLVTDQDAGPKGVFVPFFGRPASTFLGTAQFARRQRVPVVPMICVRLPDGSLRGVVEAPLCFADTGDSERDALENTTRHVAALESWVRRYPASYLWLHRRWKTQPGATEEAEAPETETVKQTARPDPPPAARS